MSEGVLSLPVDPTEDELSSRWGLSAEDLEQVYRCRGGDKRFSFALQLCVLRNCGQFLGDDFTGVPVRILNHVGRQLGMPPLLSASPPGRKKTDLEHEQRIREYLGFRVLDAEERQLLERHLETKAGEGVRGEKLLEAAEQHLRLRHVVLPARSTIDRIIGRVTSQAEEDLLGRLQSRLGTPLCSRIEELLQVTDGEQRSMLARLKEYPSEPNAEVINDWLDRAELLDATGISKVDLSEIDAHTVDYLAQNVRAYDVDDLKRFSPAKRQALVACFLVDAQKTTLDLLVEMNHVYITGLSRRARNAFEERHREVRKRGKKGLGTVVRAMEILLDGSIPKESRVINLFMEFEDKVLRDALVACRELHAIAEHGYVDELRARHHHLKRYLARFVTLPFRGERGSAALLAALKLARRMAAGEVAHLPLDAPTGFVPSAWRRVLHDSKERIDLRVWELALAFAVDEALRSGDLYLPQSRQHVSFWNLVYGEDRWRERRQAAYVELQLPPKPTAAISTLQSEYEAAARELAGGLQKNRFAAVVDGKLQLHKRDAIDQPPHVRELRRVIETHLPRIRIEDLLVEVDSWCHFTDALAPLGGYRPRVENLYPKILAALVAHGTNLGITTMAQSTEGITVDHLDHVSQRYLRSETLKAANKILVDFHHCLPLASAWGQGISSSSDGQRFGVQASSLLASFYPRYFGYYDRAITVYTHVSDQFSAFSSRAISCSPREAIYVLDGLLENDTLLHPREHYTDTHGFTEHVFALCYLLGFSFMPRLKDLKDQHLWRMERSTSHGPIDALFSGTADTALIAEQWDQLVRIAASLRNRTAPAHVVLDRLAASSPADRLARAMTMLGRIVKTTYIMRYLHDPAMRDRGHLQLNRGESRHELARRLFFANQGAFRSGDYEEIMNKVSALALLANAVLVWNTVRIAEILRGLGTTTGKPVPLEDVARVSPLAHAHVIPSGTYRFPVRARPGPLPNG